MNKKPTGKLRPRHGVRATVTAGAFALAFLFGGTGIVVGQSPNVYMQGCVDLATAMKNKVHWIKSSNYAEDLEYLFENSTWKTFQQATSFQGTMGFVIDDLPIQMGSNFSESEYDQVVQKLKLHYHIEITASEQQEFTEESLSDGEIKALRDCIVESPGIGFTVHEFAARDSANVYLSIRYSPLPSSSGIPKCVVTVADPGGFKGVTFQNAGLAADLAKGLELTPNQWRDVTLTRETDTSGMNYLSGNITFHATTSTGDVTVPFRNELVRAPDQPIIHYEYSTKDYLAFGNVDTNNRGYVDICPGCYMWGVADISLGDGPIDPANICDIVSCLSINPNSGIWATGPNGGAIQADWKIFSNNMAYQDMQYDGIHHRLRFKWLALGTFPPRGFHDYEVDASLIFTLKTKKAVPGP